MLLGFIDKENEFYFVSTNTCKVLTTYCRNEESTYEGLKPDMTPAKAYDTLNQGNGQFYLVGWFDA